MNPFIKRLTKELQQQENKNLTRQLKTIQPCTTDLSGNDYLCLRKHPEVLAYAESTQRNFGAGSGASPLISGFLPCHEKLLSRLKIWKNKPGGILFNSGFVANQAVLKHLPGPKDLVLIDKFSHHSMVQALLFGKTPFKRYPHLNLDSLEELLQKNKHHYETIFVVTESVFSMDGDYPNLKRLAHLKTKYPFIWILDEAHAVGCFGFNGGGLAEQEEILDDVDIIIGTLGKALGSMGGYVLTSSTTTSDYLVNFAGELIYSTFMPPAQAGAAFSAIKLIQNMDEERKYLRTLGINFRKQLLNSGWETNSFDSQIVPIIIGENTKVIKIRDYLMKADIRVGAVRPPSVPSGTARLRISLNIKIMQEHLNKLVENLNLCRATL